MAIFKLHKTGLTGLQVKKGNIIARTADKAQKVAKNALNITSAKICRKQMLNNLLIP